MNSAGEDEGPKCYVIVDDQQCPDEACRKCMTCGEPTCLDHSYEFVSAHPRLAEFNGYYCPDCYGAAFEAYNKRLSKSGDALADTMRVGECICRCCGSLPGTAF